MDSAVSQGTYQGSIVNRSLSHEDGRAEEHGAGAAERSHAEMGLEHDFGIGFEGLNFFQQRYANGGNQFSVEPPDQALCVGNGYVVESVNDVFNVYDVTGQSLLQPNNVSGAVDLNSFFGYPAAFDRSTGVVGPEVTDPSCLYDSATHRFFLVVLTLEVDSTGALTTENHLDVAVSQSSNPTGVWNIYHVNVTGDGSQNPMPGNACPCIGDYPHIGADANGFYVTTNSYPFSGNGFNGAQIYAFSKAQLAKGAATVTMIHIDTYGSVNAPSEAGSRQPGFTVWPAQSPGRESFESRNGGTEYFLSSNATDEANMPLSGGNGPHTSTNLVVWTLSNTASLNGASPALALSNVLLGVNRYALPPTMHQPGSGTAPTTATPLGFCLNDADCTISFFGPPANPFTEVISRPDGNDSRMQQVTYAKGKLWAALDTALNPDGGPTRAGIAWYIIDPRMDKVRRQGYLGAAGRDLTYPAIGITSDGQGVMALTASGEKLYPSAAFAPIDQEGVEEWHVVDGGLGAATDDGLTSYKFVVGDPPRTRWGDYGAAAVDGESIWISSEYIAHACNYSNWLISPRCGNTRGFYGNWSTRISKFRP